MPETATSGAAPAKAPAGSPPLDELMLAMDVVDTLRHREHIVARELAAGTREEGLIERLKAIYAGQGIDVPDHILREGVEGLKRDRFVYTPPASGLSAALARAYVTRGSWSKYLAGSVVAILVAWIGYQALVVWPAERRVEARRIELQETLPASLAILRDQVRAETDDAEIRRRAEDIYDRGMTAVETGDRDTAAAATDELSELRLGLSREYEIRIVSRQGEQSGVWRVPDANESASNYYLIVEAVDDGGNVLTLPILNEETGQTERVTKWGVRVSEAVFDAVRRDKQDDGIIQNIIVAAKPRGRIEPDYRLPTLGGAITEW